MKKTKATEKVTSTWYFNSQHNATCRTCVYYICTFADYVSMCTSVCCIDSNGEASRIAVSLYRVGLNACVHYWLRQLYISVSSFHFFFFHILRAQWHSIQHWIFFLKRLINNAAFIFIIDNSIALYDARRSVFVGPSAASFL